MPLNKTLVAAAIGVSALCVAALAPAQSTDGYHTIQVFPVVVDTASFAQRFVLRNPDPDNALRIMPRYFPGEGTTQTTSLACPAITVPAFGEVVFASLRNLCPALAGGSQFGYLYLQQDDAVSRPFAAFSRIANPQGNGFTVEAFPAHTFTSADAVVTGVRRRTAGDASPAFQTNCFVGNLNSPAGHEGDDTETVVVLTLHSNTGAFISQDTVTVAPGDLVRLLDVFGATGAPAGDYEDARVRFSEVGTREPGLMTFCTAQDNTSFGADFRIAKQERGGVGDGGVASSTVQDDHVSRWSQDEDTIATSYYGSRPFVLQSGGARHNIHVMYFRHPDWIQCELLDPATGLRPTPAYGLEMRMLAQDGVEVIAGGNESTGWGRLYLGDKTERNGGANTRYTIEVENSGTNAGPNRPYRLHCRSGSGHSRGDIIEYNAEGEKF